ncbi:MAG: DUF4173 domain-containing protein [Dehalococcoidia bacterium]|nr:DUF4173 domain-containing protein [Dehalococcoidia bacterium]
MTTETSGLQGGRVVATGTPQGARFLEGLDALIASVIAPPFTLGVGATWAIAGLAIGLGVALDVLFSAPARAPGSLEALGTPVGINLPLWVALIVGTVIASASRLGRPLATDRVAALVGAVVLYSVFAWRDSIALSVFGWLGGTSLLFLGVALPRGASLWRLGVTSCALALASGIVALSTAPLRVGVRLLQSVAPTLRTGRHTVPLARGIVIALPLVAVFGTLFVAADAVFAEGASRLFSFDLEWLRPHLLRIGFGSVVGLAALWAAVGTEAPRDLVVEVPERTRLGRLEVGLVLGSLAVLFALFVFVQVRYLFGGADLVRASVSLTYAQYARRGFFELVLAALLLLPVLAGINWARERNAPALRLFLGLAGALGALLLVVLASAGQRLAVYLDAYGLTELRLYAVATLPWLVVTLVAFFVLVVRGRVDAFLSTAVGLAALVLVGLFVLSPNAFIARTNLDRIASGRPFDAEYVSSLGADAAPVLASRLGELSESDRCVVVESLLAHRTAAATWSGWNYARARAASAVAGLEACR